MSQNQYPSGWYAALESQGLKKNKPKSIIIFGLNLVLWRNKNSHPVAMLDQCPHRSAKLSLGRQVNNAIECPFHGFQFSENGECQHAPEFHCPLPAVKVTTFYCQELHNFIWIWKGEEQPNKTIPWPSELNSHFNYSQIKKIWNSDITRCIENQLDFTHLPFVHKTTIGRGFKLFEKRHIENSDTKINIYLHGKENKHRPSIEFFYPNIWVNKINPKFMLLLAFVPIEEGKTKLILRSYQNFIKFPVLKQIFSLILNLTNIIILNQDKQVVFSQGQSPSTEAKKEILMENDLAIKHLRKYWTKSEENK